MFGLVHFTAPPSHMKRLGQRASDGLQQLLADPTLRKSMGENGFEHVRQNFLLTRHVKDYLLAMLSLEHPGEDLVNL